jgi:hypothetical protein
MKLFILFTLYRSNLDFQRFFLTIKNNNVSSLLNLEKGPYFKELKLLPTESTVKFQERG